MPRTIYVCYVCAVSDEAVNVCGFTSKIRAEAWKREPDSVFRGYEEIPLNPLPEYITGQKVGRKLTGSRSKNTAPKKPLARRR